MITSPDKAFSVHDIGQEPMNGVHVWYWEPGGDESPIYRCEIHGYHIVEGYERPCEHVKEVMEAQP